MNVVVFLWSAVGDCHYNSPLLQENLQSCTTNRLTIEVWAGMPQRSACSAAASPAATAVRLLPSVSLLVSLPSLPSVSVGASSSPLSADISTGSPAASLAARSCHHLQQGWAGKGHKSA